MGVPYQGGPMSQHPQYITVRNSRGRELLDSLGAELIRTPPINKGDRRPIVMQVAPMNSSIKQQLACITVCSLLKTSLLRFLPSLSAVGCSARRESKMQHSRSCVNNVLDGCAFPRTVTCCGCTAGVMWTVYAPFIGYPAGRFMDVADRASFSHAKQLLQFVLKYPMFCC
jgi:hypothetical protein